MTRDEQLIKAALDIAAETAGAQMTPITGTPYAAGGRVFAAAVRALDPADVLTKVVGANEPERPVKPDPKQTMCDRCDGSGYVWAAGNCPACDGDGRIAVPQPAAAVPREALVGVIDTALIRWLKAAHDDRRSEPEAIADALLTTFSITDEEPNAMTRHENICDECGLPINICNAKAMFELAVRRNGREAVIAAILDAQTEQPTPEAVTRLVEAARQRDGGMHDHDCFSHSSCICGHDELMAALAAMETSHD